MGAIESQIFTGELTNDTLVITEGMGLRQISIFNGTSTDGSIEGTRKLGGVTSSAIAITQGESITVKAADADVIKNLTIDAPAGCTLKIVAQ